MLHILIGSILDLPVPGGIAGLTGFISFSRGGRDKFMTCTLLIVRGQHQPIATSNIGFIYGVWHLPSGTGLVPCYRVSVAATRALFLAWLRALKLYSDLNFNLFFRGLVLMFRNCAFSLLFALKPQTPSWWSRAPTRPCAWTGRPLSPVTEASVVRLLLKNLAEVSARKQESDPSGAPASTDSHPIWVEYSIKMSCVIRVLWATRSYPNLLVALNE